MEKLEKQSKIVFTGKGSEFLGLFIANILLTIITLGFYFPWAKASILRYAYSHTELDGEYFTFHGKGNEMFKGFIMAYLLILLIAAPFIIGIVTKDIVLVRRGYFLFIFGLIAIMPLAIHGRLRFRTSRSSYRGIFFSYSGSIGKLYGMCIGGAFLTIITLGFYSFWLTVKIRKYVMENIGFGDIKFTFNGDGGDYLGRVFGGYILTVMTLGIFFFKWRSSIFNFFVDNTLIEQENSQIYTQSSATGWGFCKLLVGNFFIVILTLGLGTPYAMVRSLKYYMSSINVVGDLQLEHLTQGEIIETNAFGEQLAEALGMGI